MPVLRVVRYLASGDWRCPVVYGGLHLDESVCGGAREDGVLQHRVGAVDDILGVFGAVLASFESRYPLSGPDRADWSGLCRGYDRFVCVYVVRAGKRGICPVLGFGLSLQRDGSLRLVELVV